MHVARLYTGEDGQSHFGSLELSYTEMVDSIVPKVAVATGVEFRRSPDGTAFDWHCSPSRMYMVSLSGQVEFATNEGEKRLFGPGDAILVEDVTGGGHTTKCVGEWVRITVVIPWEE